MNELRLGIIQSGISWENKEKNLNDYEALISSLEGKADLAVLPEMFTTGFSMEAAYLAETNAGNTVQTIRAWTKKYDLAIAGSFLATESENRLFNRGFFITPEGESFFSDKRHLFRISGENEVFTAGKAQPIISWRQWNIRLIVCYDLRFPVWTRNKANEYDLLLCVANWPQTRAVVWNVLLRARAIENLCYVCGVNRIGKDAYDISYQGESTVLDYKGNSMLEAGKDTESALTISLSKEKIQAFREKFPVWKDADTFEIKEN
ncbi:MAG: amidohydrolase [Candidatus Azobacteroides sp.]|nr:amidohydrolase [Candidatus Azobacteroides sp.]